MEEFYLEMFQRTNMNLKQKSSPMIFEDNIECNYKCALLNLAKGHSVPKFNKERSSTWTDNNLKTNLNDINIVVWRSFLS